MIDLHHAELRFANHYLAVLRTAGELYDQGGEALRQGLVLFESEWINIEASQTWAENHSSESEPVAQVCNDFPDGSPHLLDMRQHPRDRIRWLEAALTAARRLKDQIAEGRHLNYLGLAYSHLGELVRAIELFKNSLEIFQLAGDRRTEGELLTNIGYAYANLGEPSLAITVSEQALAIAREHEDPRSEGVALCNMGQSFYLMREFRRAIEFYEQSLKITRKIGYSAGENIVLNYLGKTYAVLNKPKQAIKFYEQALMIAREIGDRQGERNALGNLGQAYHLLNEVKLAIEFYESALMIARQIGDPLIEAEFLNSLGDAYLDADAPNQALRCYEQRLKITLEFGRRRAANVEQLFHDWTLQKAVIVMDDEPVMKHSDEASQGKLCWLHLSDFHFGGAESNRYDADIVIESLLEDIRDRIEKDGLAPDFIAVTGDLALSGKSAEYDLVRDFLEELLQISSLPRQRLFIVPGNHDVDRNLITSGALAISKDLTDRQITNKILASPDDRRLMFARFKGYSEFFNEYFKEHLVFDDERCFYVHSFEIGKLRLGILGLNSSWLAASDEDEVLKLVIGERQTRAALDAAREADIRIALLHHPTNWIRGFDHQDSVTRLLNKCDFLLHGHLHKAAATQLSTPDGNAMVIAGGACYDSREHPNSYNFVKLDLESNTGTIHFREYVDQGGGFWAKGVRLYKNAPDGVYEFTLPRK